MCFGIFAECFFFFFSSKRSGFLIYHAVFHLFIVLQVWAFQYHMLLLIIIELICRFCQLQ